MMKCGQCGAEQDEWSEWHGGDIADLKRENAWLRLDKVNAETAVRILGETLANMAEEDLHE